MDCKLKFLDLALSTYVLLRPMLTTLDLQLTSWQLLYSSPVLELVHQYSAPYLSANWSAFFSISLDDQSDYNNKHQIVKFMLIVEVFLLQFWRTTKSFLVPMRNISNFWVQCSCGSPSHSLSLFRETNHYSILCVNWAIILLTVYITVKQHFSVQVYFCELCESSARRINLFSKRGCFDRFT